MRVVGPGEIGLPKIKELVGVRSVILWPSRILSRRELQVAEKYASELAMALTNKLKEEDVRRTEKARKKFASVR